MRQYSLFPGQFHSFHGGEIAAGKRKSLRPLARNRPIHLVAKAKKSLKQEREWIRKEAGRIADRFMIKAYRITVAEDHVHLLIQIPGRSEYSSFIRGWSAQIAKKMGRGLWLFLPFTRVASWGRDFKNLLGYLQKNEDEACGDRPYNPRKDWYKRFKRKNR
jgi:REP element-mobilizing transposase RayT